MRNLLFVLTIFYVLNANAQNYLISFTGSGESTTVNTVKVENLTAGTTLTLNGDDLLQLTITTGVHSTENEQSSEMKIFPNPMNDNSKIEIFPPEVGEAIISVYEMTGKLVSQIHSYLENYRQEFRLSGLKNGIYIINVKGNTYQFSGKLISTGKSNETTSIEKISNNIAVDKKTSNMDTKGVQATVDMEYTTGDVLKFTAISGNYSTVTTVIPEADKLVPFNFIGCTDGDDNNYSVVDIGGHVWMAENLKTTKYSDGTPIPLVNNVATWAALNENSKAYCWYGDDISNKDTYGALYTWPAAMNGALSSSTKPSGVHGICPTSWHLPSDAEWAELETYFGGSSIAGGKLKETGTIHWKSPNSEGTNESGYTALPGSYRSHTGTFSDIGYFGYWWSSTELNAINTWNRYMSFGNSYVFRSNVSKRSGFSVRCIKDNM